jgi:hypothetical protein
MSSTAITTFTPRQPYGGPRRTVAVRQADRRADEQTARPARRQTQRGGLPRLAPQLLDAAHAAPLIRAAFNRVERLAFRILGIKQFMRLQLAAR